MSNEYNNFTFYRQTNYVTLISPVINLYYQFIPIYAKSITIYNGNNKKRNDNINSLYLYRF